ncbi:MAG TPA: hypothetical protein DCM57_04935 [Treponema sp.]|nr:hypothetical protein [Treponema sp.]HBB42679.1 hypothetical protein [Treponema sp.]
MMMTIWSSLGRLKTRFLLLCVIAFCAGGKLCAEEWVLAARKFTVEKSSSSSQAREDIAEKLPQLILEQLSQNAVRLTTETEMINRALESLRTERQSLLLQLSAEVKKRDSLVLQEDNPKSLQKKIKAQEKAVQAVQQKIDDNLKNVEEIRAKADGSFVPDEKKKDFFQMVASWFSPKKEKTLVSAVQYEDVSLYQNDSEKLFSVDESIAREGVESRVFKNAVSSAGIRGLILGNLRFFGNYVSVTVDLRIFPGAESAGVVTEVGALDNLVGIASNVAQYLSPLLVNSSGIMMYFYITPAEAAENARIYVDGVISPLKDNGLFAAAGTHTVEVSSEGYTTQIVTAVFKDSPAFFVQAALDPVQEGDVNLVLKNPVEGTLFANAMAVGNAMGVGTVHINGKSVIGQVVRPVRIAEEEKSEQNENAENPQDGESESEITEDGAGQKKDDERATEVKEKMLTAFYYIPFNAMEPGKTLIADAKPVDAVSLIDSRRRWSYIGYTVFIMSLPPLFYTIGGFNNAYRGYYTGGVKLSEVQGWNVARWVATGFTVLAGGFFIFELVRYLRAASSVLPANARSVREREIPIVESAKSWMEQTDEQAAENPVEVKTQEEAQSENSK